MASRENSPPHQNPQNWLNLATTNTEFDSQAQYNDFADVIFNTGIPPQYTYGPVPHEYYQLRAQQFLPNISQLMTTPQLIMPQPTLQEGQVNLITQA